MKKFALSLFGILFAVSVQASVTNMAGTWSGTGTFFDANYKKQGEYKISMVGTKTSDTAVAIKGTVTMSDGKTEDFTETLQDTATGFTMENKIGKGTGICLGMGILQVLYSRDQRRSLCWNAYHRQRHPS